MKSYGGVDVFIHVFFTSAVVGSDWSASRLCRFTPEKRAPGTHWVGGLVGSSTGVVDVKNLDPTGHSVIQPVASRSIDRSTATHVH
jgi:hypothetical protein